MQDENLIVLLSETLKFYSKEENYENDQINLDKGTQARFILDLIKKNKEQIISYEQEFQKHLENDVISSEIATKMIESLKNMK